MECKNCGTSRGLGLFIENVKRLIPEGVYCRNCVPKGREHTNKDGTVYYRTEEISIDDLEKITMMENPDIACDFCGKHNPQWLFDLSMRSMKTIFGIDLDFGNRWASCRDCVTKMEAGEMPSKPSTEGMSPMHLAIHLTQVDQLHRMVIDCISNKRAYVRDDADGRVKIK